MLRCHERVSQQLYLRILLLDEVGNGVEVLSRRSESLAGFRYRNQAAHLVDRLVALAPHPIKNRYEMFKIFPELLSCELDDGYMVTG